MFPRYGKIFSKYSVAANTPEKAVTATVNALTDFWKKFQEEYSFAKFMFDGTSITGPVTVPVKGPISGFNLTTQLSIPTEEYVKLQLQSGGDAFLGLFRLFSYTINMSKWNIDCKAGGFATPMLAPIIADFDIQALAFKTKMFGLAPDTHEKAMDILSDGVEDIIKTCISVVEYTGTVGPTQLTGMVTIQF
jgi:hypothetical protein